MGVFLRCSKPSSFSGLPEQKLNKGWVDFYCAWVRRCFSAVCGCRLAGIRVVRRGLLVLCVRVERKKKKKKCCGRVIEKGKIKLMRELVSEYYSSKLVSIFTHQNFLVKVVRLLGVIL